MATREGKDPAGHGYAFSMAKRDATATKTAQLKCVNLLDFRGFCRVLLYRVSAGIALITQSAGLLSAVREAQCATTVHQLSSETERENP